MNRVQRVMLAFLDKEQEHLKTLPLLERAKNIVRGMKTFDKDLIKLIVYEKSLNNLFPVILKNIELPDDVVSGIYSKFLYKYMK